MDGLLRIAADPLHELLLAGMTSVQAVPPRVRLSNDWARLVEQAVLDGAPSCLGNSHPPGAIRAPGWPIGRPAGLGVTAVAVGELPLQLVMAQPSAAGEPLPRKVLLPRKSATPRLHETLAWHGPFRWTTASRWSSTR